MALSKKYVEDKEDMAQVQICSNCKHPIIVYGLKNSAHYLLGNASRKCKLCNCSTPWTAQTGRGNL